jgi:hypothetical protein
MAPILNAAGPPDVGALREVQGRYGLTMDMISVDRLAREHGLALA